MYIRHLVLHCDPGQGGYPIVTHYINKYPWVSVLLLILHAIVHFLFWFLHDDFINGAVTFLFLNRA